MKTIHSHASASPEDGVQQQLLTLLYKELSGIPK